MWATNPVKRPFRRPNAAQRGTAAVEFALMSIVFFSFVFGVIELARLMYVYNTLQEVTRRVAVEAVKVFPGDAAELAKVKEGAVFDASTGELPLAPPVTNNHVRIDYLALTRDNSGALTMTEIPTSDLPTCPGQNRATCLHNPNAANCIRFVRVRICDPANAATCDRVESASMLPLASLRPVLHQATTIAVAESLGYQPGTPPCLPVTP